MPRTALQVRTAPPSNELTHALDALTESLELTAEFPPHVEKEAATVIGALQLPDRDLTSIEFLTIDPEGSTDLDQALHITSNGDGYTVRYAIADVPAYVEPGGAIDAEARERGQTMYLPTGRIPLHPVSISEDAASLLPDRDRGAFVWEFALDAEANVTSTSVARARVRSRSKLSYDDAQKAIDDGSGTETLILLKEVGLGRIALEQKRGGASLNVPDTEIEVVDGHYTLVRRSPLPIENWNAQISLMTGMAAAELMIEARVGILRTMPAPDPEAVAAFRRRSVALGHAWAEGMPYGGFLRSLDVTNPRELAIMHAAASLFRGAGYTDFDGALPEERKQAAVAAPYAHVTAPLRRLVDRFALVVCEAVSEGKPVPEWVRAALPSLPAAMAASGAREGKLSRSAIDTVEAALVADRVGQQFDVTVISANGSKGIVQLAEPAITATCIGELVPGTVIRATLTEANIAEGSVVFTAVD